MTTKHILFGTFIELTSEGLDVLMRLHEGELRVN